MATNMLLNAEQVSSLIDAHIQADLGVTFTKGAAPPSSPKQGDQWLNTTGGNAAEFWPLKTFLDGQWIDTRRFNPTTQAFLGWAPEQDSTPVAIHEITKAVSPPTTPEEGNIWWQSAGNQLIQHVFFDGAWQLTGASYDTQTQRYVPVSIGDGLTYGADGVMAAVASGGGTGFAAGDIVISLDDPLPSTLLELNGVIYVNGTTQYPGICARYPWMVIGSSLHLPNFRGAVPRHLDTTSIYDPDTNSRLARAGDQRAGPVVGSYQLDSVGQHDHPVMSNFIMSAVLSNPPHSLLITQHDEVGVPELRDSARTLIGGGEETRMKNVAVRYCFVAG